MDDQNGNDPFSVPPDPASGVSADYLEALYATYLEAPDSLTASWRDYFRRNFPSGSGDAGVLARPQEMVSQGGSEEAVPVSNIPRDARWRDLSVRQLVDAYRELGHMVAAIDPLGLRKIPDIVELGLEYHGLSEADLDTTFDAEGLGNVGRAPLRGIIELLKKAYCGSLGVEYTFIPDRNEKLWIREQIEQRFLSRVPLDDERRNLLFRLTAAESLERYLHSRYVGQKRFSLEGAESLIPLIDTLIGRGALHGVQEVAIGMAHRGR
ncbi:MAG: 2-oxoglutarate dehydrogenase E1 component, partial [Gammaproteobacteria bacterium]|nr:2-oxoglutarate dehydrogenase E1 component [Gammaproteobacteria bacterium]